MDWDLLRYFLPVARLGSLTKAAEVLKTTQSTVSRRLGELESALGVVLFTRTPHGYDLTPEGSAFLVKAQGIEDQFVDLERALHGDAASESLGGTVRLATAENLSTAILVPSLGALRSRHPGLAVELSTGVRSVSMMRREADLSLRLVRPTQNTLTVRKVGVQAHAVYAAPSYLSERGTPDGLEGLRDADLIGWDDEFASLQMAVWLKEVTGDRPLMLATTSLAPQIVAVRCGLGLAVLPCFLGDTDPGMRRVVQPDEVFSQDLWLTLDPTLAKVPRVRAVADWVVETVAAKAGVLSGGLAR
jgi:DNA-binding transcriptional LysR family regulator